MRTWYYEEAAKQFVAAANAMIRAQVQISAHLLGIDLTLVDINPLFTQLVYTPSAFGFANSVGAAYNPNTGIVSPDPNEFVFWDAFHPTTPMHYLTAQLIYQNAVLAASSESHLSLR